MLEFINVMRVVGTILITNSHFDRIWPVAALATGGTLGNIIFFFVAGYCYSPKEKNIFHHIIIKFIKLYIPIFIVQLVCTISGIYRFPNIKEFLEICLFPTNYWFFPCILIGYSFWFVIIKHRISILSVSVIALVGSVIAYFPWGVFITYPFYLAVMGAGVYSRQKKLTCSKVNLTHVFCAVVAFYVIKYYSVRCVAIGALENTIALFAVLLFYLWVSQKEVVLKRNNTEIIHKTVSMIASMSWHIYLVQVPILKKMFIPDSFFGAFFLACFSILSCAVMLKYVDSKINSVILKRKKYGKKS